MVLLQEVRIFFAEGLMRKIFNYSEFLDFHMILFDSF